MQLTCRCVVLRAAFDGKWGCQWHTSHVRRAPPFCLGIVLDRLSDATLSSALLDKSWTVDQNAVWGPAAKVRKPALSTSDAVPSGI
jgi:hypothetical protein